MSTVGRQAQGLCLAGFWEGTKQSCKDKNFVHARPAQPAAIMRHAVDAQHYSLHSSLTKQPCEAELEEAESMASYQYALNEPFISVTKSF